jgi:hypothetical protein
VRKPALVRTVRTALAASAALLAIVPLSAPAQESESDPAEAEAETEAEASDSGPTENIEEIEVVGELTEGLGSASRRTSKSARRAARPPPSSSAASGYRISRRTPRAPSRCTWTTCR